MSEFPQIKKVHVLPFFDVITCIAKKLNINRYELWQIIVNYKGTPVSHSEYIEIPIRPLPSQVNNLILGIKNAQIFAAFQAVLMSEYNLTFDDNVLLYVSILEKPI